MVLNFIKIDWIIVYDRDGDFFLNWVLVSEMSVWIFSWQMLLITPDEYCFIIKIFVWVCMCVCMCGTYVLCVSEYVYVYL